MCARVNACRVVSDEDFEESGKGGLSDDELFKPFSDKRWVQIFFSKDVLSEKGARASNDS